MDAGVLKSNWLTPVSRLLILVGRTLTSLLTTTITSTVMLIIGAHCSASNQQAARCRVNDSHPNVGWFIRFWLRLCRHRPFDARGEHIGRCGKFPRAGIFRNKFPGEVAAVLVDPRFAHASADLWSGCRAWLSFEDKYASAHQRGDCHPHCLHVRDAVGRRADLLQSRTASQNSGNAGTALRSREKWHSILLFKIEHAC